MPGLGRSADRTLSHGHGGSAYYVFDDDLITVHDFLSELLRSQNLALLNASIPAPAARFLARLLDIAWRARRRPGAPPLSRLRVALNSGPFVVSDRLARTELGDRPSTSRGQGLAALRVRQPTGAAE